MARHLVYVLCAASAAHFALDAAAAVPVEESVAEVRENRTETQRPPPPRTFSALPTVETEQPAEGNQRLSQLFYQLQILQQEVQELRGIAEEQTYQLNRLARDQKEQYIDLDRRMAALRSNSPTPAVSGSTSNAGSFSTTPGEGSGTERDAYTAAFNLMKGRQFEESAMAFNQLIVDYPNGQYTPNAFYWLGELYLTNVETEKARQSFVQVVNLYPDHQKVPDALYKLGVVYHRLGDTQQALRYLDRVRSEHPQSSAAGLAETYASELQ